MKDRVFIRVSFWRGADRLAGGLDSIEHATGPSSLIRKNTFKSCQNVPTSLADRFALLHWLANMDFFLPQAILAKKYNARRFRLIGYRPI